MGLPTPNIFAGGEKSMENMNLICLFESNEKDNRCYSRNCKVKRRKVIKDEIFTNYKRGNEKSRLG